MKASTFFNSEKGQAVLNKYKEWQLLRTLKEIYENQYTGYYEPSTTGFSDSFDKWLESECGIRIFFNGDGNIRDKFHIIDEAKYAWMLLKYK